MTLIYPDCFSVRAIARYFSLLLASILVIACTEAPKQETPAATTQAPIPTLGAQPSSSMPLGIAIGIDISQVRAALPETAMVFVFIREPGQRMPLAVEHFPIAEVPTTVEFASTEARDTVEAVVRVSPSGSVDRRDGDYEVSAMSTLAHPPAQVNLVVGEAVSHAQRGMANAPPVPAANTATSEITVNVSAKVADSLADDLTVFVVAKSPDGPIPLAVKRLQLGDLPTQIVLSDADSMMPTRKLSLADAFSVSAHISQGGDASRKPGDWIGFAKNPSETSSTTYDVIISEQIN